MTHRYETNAERLFHLYPKEIKRFIPFMTALCKTKRFVEKSPVKIVDNSLWKWHVLELRTILNADTGTLAENANIFANQLFYLLRACISAHCLFNYIKHYQKSLPEDFSMHVEMFFHDLKD